MAPHTLSRLDVDTAQQHLARLGFLTNYVEDFSLEPEYPDDLFMDGTLNSKEAVLIPKSLIDSNSRTILNYLHDFGYLDSYTSLKSDGSEVTAMMSTDDLEGALALFQFTNSLHPTGSVDKEVKAQMKIPRCALPDIDPDDPGNIASLIGMGTVKDVNDLKDRMRNSVYNLRTNQEIPLDGRNSIVTLKKKYDIADEKWPRNRLAFHIGSLSDTLGKRTISELLRAFEVWTQSVEIYLYQVM